MAGDGEARPLFFECKVIHAKSKEEAVILSKSVITSNLTKAAIFGHAPTGAGFSALWAIPALQFDPEKVDLYFESAAGKLKIIENGVGHRLQRGRATKILSEKQ
mgnify:CR=1 FL=1